MKLYGKISKRLLVVIIGAVILLPVLFLSPQNKEKIDQISNNGKWSRGSSPENNKIGPTSVLFPTYSEEFTNWFVTSPDKQWKFNWDGDKKFLSSYHELTNYTDEKYSVSVSAYPFIERWFVRNSQWTDILLGDPNKKPRIDIKQGSNYWIAYFDIGGPLHHVWKPKLYDLDNDKISEIWIRYNSTHADGFSQNLDIYKLQKDHTLMLVKGFSVREGVVGAEDGGGIVKVAENIYERGNKPLESTESKIETWEYKNGRFIKTNEEISPVSVFWETAD